MTKRTPRESAERILAEYCKIHTPAPHECYISKYSPDAVIPAVEYLREHPADDCEHLDIGTLYLDDTTCIETRVVGVGKIAVAISSVGTDWDWCHMRTWEYPEVPTRGDVRRLLAALGIEVKS